MDMISDKIPNLQERVDHIFHKQLYGIAITELTSLLARRSVYCSKYPNSVYSISTFDDAEGNIRFKKLQHTWREDRCAFCGASKTIYERDEILETHAYFLGGLIFGGGPCGEVLITESDFNLAPFCCWKSNGI